MLLTTGQMAKICNVSSQTVVSWERRYGLPCERVGNDSSSHRRFDRLLALAMRDALQEGYWGESAVERAIEIKNSGRHRDPLPVQERLLAIEKRIAHMENLLAILVNRV